MIRVWLTFTAGVLAASAAGFFSPLWYLGFVPLAAGLIWAAYDLVDVPKEALDGKPSATPY